MRTCLEREGRLEGCKFGGRPVIRGRFRNITMDDLDIPQSLRYLAKSGSAKVTGGPPGLQIQCGALEPSRVGSIPMHFRQLFP